MTKQADAPGFRFAIINGVVEVPFCPDTGADLNIIGGDVVNELRTLSPGTTVVSIDPPVEVRVAGGATIMCREVISVDVHIVTATGSVQLRGIDFFVLDRENELLIGGAH